MPERHGCIHIFSSCCQLFSCSVMSNSLQPHGLQHVRLPYPPLSPGVYSSSCPLSQWCYLTISPSATLVYFAFNLSLHQDLFKWVISLHQVPKDCSFSVSASNEYPGLISFRVDWFDLHAVQGTLKRLLQHHNSKASILQHSASFIVQFSHPYMTTGKTIALTMNLCWQSNVFAF